MDKEWLITLIIYLLIPLLMTGLGRLFLFHAPREINVIFGYRTKMSMKNKETWEFAHHYCGRIWFTYGIILLFLTLIIMFVSYGKAEDTVETYGIILCILQLIGLIGVIYPTERALRKKFDKDGNRIN